MKKFKILNSLKEIVKLDFSENTYIFLTTH